MPDVGRPVTLRNSVRQHLIYLARERDETLEGTDLEDLSDALASLGRETYLALGRQQEVPPSHSAIIARFEDLAAELYERHGPELECVFWAENDTETKKARGGPQHN